MDAQRRARLGGVEMHLLDKCIERLELQLVAQPSDEVDAQQTALSELGDAYFVKFTAQTRMSGVDHDGKQVRKGAADSVWRRCPTTG